MIYIDNLCEFVRRIIDIGVDGTFFPQNGEYVNTSEMVKLIAEAHGRKIRMTTCFNWALKRLRVRAVRKLFGSLTYNMELSRLPESDYRVVGFRDSILASEMQ